MSHDSSSSGIPADMRWHQLEGAYALAGFPEMPAPRVFEMVLDSRGGQVIREGGETTVLLPMDSLPELEVLHPSLRAERDLIWYRFESPMGWDVVGFLALVTAKLAEAGVPVCAICAYSRDYVVIARSFEVNVRSVLGGLFPESD